METYIFALFIVVTGVIAAWLEMRDLFKKRDRVVVSVGGGIASTLRLTLKALQMYDFRAVDLVMCWLPNEDPEMLKMISYVEQLTGKQIKLIGGQESVFDIFLRVRMLGNTRQDPCSRIGKREMMLDYLNKHYDKATTILCVGIGYYEIDRMAAIRKNWTSQGWTVVAPLAEDKTVDRASNIEFCRMMFGWVPELYELDFEHFNCDGACVKAGKGQWARLLWYRPQVYAKWEDFELSWQDETGLKYTILRDERKGKETAPLTLREHRLRMEAKWRNLKPGQDPFKPPFVAPQDVKGPACWYCDAA